MSFSKLFLDQKAASDHNLRKRQKSPPAPKKKNQNHGACKNWKLLLIPELYKVSSSYCTQRSFSLKGGLSYEINLRIQFIPLKQETWECNKGSCGLVSVGNIIFTFSLKFI